MRIIEAGEGTRLALYRNKIIKTKGGELLAEQPLNRLKIFVVPLNVVIGIFHTSNYTPAKG